MQETNERMYCKKHIDTYIQQFLTEDPAMQAKITEGAIALGFWLQGDYYESKNKRLAQINGLDLEDIVLRIFSQIAYCQTPETFVSVTSQLAGFLGFDDKEDSIKTIAEMVAVLCQTDVFDIIKESPEATMMVQSNIPLPKALVDAAVRSKYLLPMVCEPDDVTSNFESPYLTFNDSLILGKGNNHSGDICLDVINTQNKIPLKLDLRFLSTVEEEPTFELDSLEKVQAWSQFKQESYETYWLLAKQGNQFWLTNKVDKRGRLYAQGYHVTSQGSAFKKAMLELYEEELVEGVPDAYSL
jgi:hypothetical protein